MQKQLVIPFSLEGQADITNVKDINESFATGTLKIMYLGKNRNGSSFTKDAVLKAIPSLYNVPIVANYNRELDEIGGHDIDVVHKGDSLSLVNLTQPCGVIPEHANLHFDVLLDDSGVCHEYLIADDVILWKRQEVYEALMGRYDGNISHSMEINVRDGFFDAENELYHVHDFEFTALCLLGNCDPCFEGSSLAINQQMFSLQFNQMMKEMKETFASMNKQSTFDENEIDIEVKGGEEMTDENKELETVAVEEQVEPAEEVVEEENKDESVDSIVDEPEVEEVEEEDEAAKEFAEEAYAALEPMMAEKDYWLLNIGWNNETNQFKAIAQSKVDHRAYALTATKSEEGYSVDWENRVEKAFAVVDADTPLAYADLPGTIEILKSINEYSDKVTEYNNHLNAANEELAILRAFKAEIEANEVSAAIEELFAKFADLNGLEEFEALKEHAVEFDLEALEEKLYAIRGKNVRSENFSAKRPIGVRLGIGSIKEKEEYEPYGKVFKKYNIKAEEE